MCALLAKLLITCALFSACAHADLSDYETACKDEEGQNVDWFYLYKLPGKFHGKGQTKGGLYYYLTSEMSKPQWKLSTLDICDAQSMAGQTLTQAYFSPNQTKGHRMKIAYNDDPPNEQGKAKYGHLKGVVVADKHSGFWMVHSVPGYPDITSNPKDYEYPASGMIYGQSYLCLSLNAEQIDVVGKQLIYDEPQIYDSAMPSSLETIYPNIIDVIQGKRIKNAPFSSDVELTTINGATFRSFAKSSKFFQDLYEDWIAPTLNTNLYVETWRRGKDISSSCTQTTNVWNVSKIKFNKAIFFKSTHDHSKWAVSDKDSEWVCVGDINRGEKQMKRGGGSVCQHSKDIAKSYRSLVVDFEPC